MIPINNFKTKEFKVDEWAKSTTWSIKAFPHQISSLITVSKQSQLKGVNLYVSEVCNYIEDTKKFLSPPEETLRQGQGNCGDLSLLKYALLRKLKWSNIALAIIVCNFGGKNEQKLLLAKNNDDVFVLDNLTPAVHPSTFFNKAKPIYMLNEIGSWYYYL